MNQDDPAARKRITLSLAQYLRRKVDPDMNGLWTFHGDPAYDDIVYYMLQVLHLDGLDSTLLNVRFIWARATQGLGAVEALLQDYQHARSAVSSAKYSDLKDHLQVLKQASQALLPSHTRMTQYCSPTQVRKSTRTKELRLLAEYRELVGANTVTLAAFPHVCFQLALNQPNGAEPQLQAMVLLQRQLRLARGTRRGSSRAIAAEARERVVPVRFLTYVNKPARKRVLCRFKYSSGVTALATQPTLASGGSSGSGSSRAVGRRGSSKRGLSISGGSGGGDGYGNGSDIMVMAHLDGSVRQVETTTGQVLHELLPPGTVRATQLAYSSDSLRIAAGMSDGSVVVWNSATLTRFPIVHASGADGADSSAAADKSRHGGAVAALVWFTKAHPRMLATAHDDSALRVWGELKATGADMAYECLFTKDWLKTSIMAMAYHLPSNSIVSGHRDGTFRVWDASSPTLDIVESASVPAHSGLQCTAVALSGDCKWLATGGSDGTVLLYRGDGSSGIAWMAQPLTGGKHKDMVTGLTFRADGDLLVSTSQDRQSLVWDIDHGKRLAILSAHTDAVSSALFVAGGDQLVTGAADSYLMMWDISSIEADGGLVNHKARRSGNGAAAKAELEAEQRVAAPVARPDSMPRVPKLLSGGDTAIALIDAAAVRDPSALKPSDAHTAHGTRVTASAVTGDGRFAATGAKSGEIKVRSGVVCHCCVHVAHGGCARTGVGLVQWH